MIDKEIIVLYRRWLNEVCRCHEDEKGNYPCDYGVKCDRCETPDITLERYLEMERNK